jgi:hypothetical protein
MAPRWLETVALAALPLAVAGCGTDAVGIQACRQIQAARCQQASPCGITLQPPYHSSGTDVEACVRFYDDACFHGLASGTDPGPIAVNACVAAINRAPMIDGGCSVVASPQMASACSWLAANSPVSDAASGSAEPAAIDAGAADATSE